jgi:hypothetical protein
MADAPGRAFRYDVPSKVRGSGGGAAGLSSVAGFNGLLTGLVRCFFGFFFSRPRLSRLPMTCSSPLCLAVIRPKRDFSYGDWPGRMAIDTSIIVLTMQSDAASVYSEMKPLPTSEVVRLLGVHPITLEHWLRRNPELKPRALRIGGRVVRLWTMKDVVRLKRFKANQRRGPKPKPKR